MDFPATRSQAWSRLLDFVPRTFTYGRDRNYVFPDHGNVSRLSPAIRHRLITEQDVVRHLLALGAFARAEKFIQEVCWRTYWKGWLEQRPDTWGDYQRVLSAERNGLTTEQKLLYENLIAARSGSGVIDYFTRELGTTGYLHNHARMWWASYWIHEARLPWALGCAHFAEKLLDFDPASNTLSWRWVAGLQTHGKTYLLRRSNVEKYAKIPADISGLPEEPSPCLISDPPTPAVRALPDLPSSVSPSNQRTLLLLHAEDLSVETSGLANLQPDSILLLSATNHTSSDSARRWLKTALADTIDRARTHYGREVHSCDSFETLQHQIRQAKPRRLVYMAPFCGPLADKLNILEQEWLSSGFEVVRTRRSWDTALFPLARRGFFPFWQQVAKDIQQQAEWLTKP